MNETNVGPGMVPHKRNCRCDECQLERLRDEVNTLAGKVQYLVDHWPGKLEDGGITFPDGEFWEKSK